MVAEVVEKAARRRHDELGPQPPQLLRLRSTKPRRMLRVAIGLGGLVAVSSSGCIVMRAAALRARGMRLGSCRACASFGTPPCSATAFPPNRTASACTCEGEGVHHCERGVEPP